MADAEEPVQLPHPSPTMQAEDTDLTSTVTRDSAADRCYDYGAMSDALSPVDEERQSRPTKQILQAQNNTFASVTASTATAPLNTAGMRVYHNPAMGPLTPPRSPQVGEVLYHNQQQQQAIHLAVDSGPITPPRSARRSKSRKSASKRSSSKKSRNGNKQTDLGTSSASAAEISKGGGGGVASSIKKSLSNLSLFTSTDGDTGDEEQATGASSMRFGTIKSYHDEDPTSAHHRAELYGQIGGPTGLIGAYGEKRGCKRMLVLITLAFILLSLVLQRISDEDGNDNNGNVGYGIGGTGKKEGADMTKPSSTEKENSFLNGEIGELTPGKCKRIIDYQTEELDVAVGKNEDLENKIKRLETVVEELKGRLQKEQKQEN